MPTAAPNCRCSLSPLLSALESVHPCSFFGAAGAAHLALSLAEKVGQLKPSLSDGNRDTLAHLWECDDADGDRYENCRSKNGDFGGATATIGVDAEELFQPIHWFLRRVRSRLKRETPLTAGRSSQSGSRGLL